MATIQRIARGVLSLFDMKSAAGQTPAELAQIVAPVVDFEPYYLSDALLVVVSPVFNVTTASQPAGAAILTVPSGEIWRVLSVGWNTSNYVGAPDYRIAVSCTPPGSGSSCPLTPEVAGTVGPATSDIRAGYTVPPFVLGSGGSIFAASGINPGAALTFDLRCRSLIHRLVA